MIITNKLGLPDAFVNAVSNERHNGKGELSATTLIKGVREIILEDRHFDEIEIDASDMVNAIFGTAVHSIFENAESSGFKEEKLSVGIMGIKVTGKIDLYDMEHGTVFDYKTASVWKVMVGDFKDWRQQGLIYAWLLRINGFRCDHVTFLAELKDFSRTKAATDASYPQSPVYKYEFDITDADMSETQCFIMQKVQAYKEACSLSDDAICQCTASERWAKPTTWAVMKIGRKTAVKVHEDCDSAEAHAKALGEGHYVTVRKGESTKCLYYCNARAFCKYANKEE